MPTRTHDIDTARIVEAYRVRTPRSCAAHRRAVRRLPGGVNRNITHLSPHPLYVDSGEGAYLVDLDGNRYLDLLGNYTSMILGCGDASMARAIVSQLARGSAWAAASAAEFKLADAISQRVPSMQQVRFASSGTEATFLAMRAARAATGRDRVAKFEGGYHGQHDYAVVSLAPHPDEWGAQGRPRAIAPIGVPDATRDTMSVLPFNDAEAVEAFITEHWRSLAAVIVEPVMGVAGVIQPQDGFLTKLREVTRRHGIVLIFDEVISFRMAYGGAQEVFGVRPDLTTLGKVIGGGLPVGAVGGDPAIMSVFDPDRAKPVMFSGTFHANPLVLQAGLATLDALDIEAIGALNAKASRLFHELEQMLSACNRPVRLNSAGSLFNLHFSAVPVTDYRTSYRADKEMLKWLHLALLNRGVMVAPRGLGCLSVPMHDGDLDWFLTQMDLALRDLDHIT